jgi:hypothetical protein
LCIQLPCATIAVAIYKILHKRPTTYSTMLVDPGFCIDSAISHQALQLRPVRKMRVGPNDQVRALRFVRKADATADVQRGDS